jgi:hypothetical protein
VEATVFTHVRGFEGRGQAAVRAPTPRRT